MDRVEPNVHLARNTLQLKSFLLLGLELSTQRLRLLLQRVHPRLNIGDLGLLSGDRFSLGDEPDGSAKFIAALKPLIGAIDVELIREASLLADQAENKQTPEGAARWLNEKIGKR